MGNFIDMTGQRFGRLVVKERAVNRGEQTYWICICDCGNTKVARASDLRRGHTKSCGCLHKEVVAGTLHHKINTTTHGKSNTRLYRIWSCMKTRCYNEKWINYKNYGGRGIAICDDWRNDFQAFYTWALSHGYSDTLTIDRIDVNGNYEPTNCRWITLKEQQSNRTNTKKQG